jgi:aryl-alcohol dehydrogenase-like predicted oxidoreductase
MHKRRLGNSTLEISELSFGTWLTVAGGIERQQAIRCIQTAFDNGINFFDTANQYGAGEGEQIVGEALRKYSRDRYLIATKLFFSRRRRPRSWTFRCAD